jgi:tRNA-dihydrouridine synthase C
VARKPADPGLFLAVAPMDGVTDHVQRELAARIGGVSMCVTEFVRITDAAPPPKVFLRACPELRRGGVTSNGTPVFVQLLGSDPGAMADAARVAAELGAPGIDINFGCPAKRVNQHDGGASLLRCPERTALITRAVRDAVPPHVPVTAKIRLGWANADDVVRIAENVERGGASWLTIHARTKAQMYAPPVDYRAVGRASAAVRIPIVANGDVTNAEALTRCARESAASGYMLGRGALADPFVFQRLRGETAPDVHDLEAFRSVLEDYELLMADAGLEPDGRLRRIKQWLGLARAVCPGRESIFDRVKRSDDLPSALRAISGRPDALP